MPPTPAHPLTPSSAKPRSARHRPAPAATPPGVFTRASARLGFDDPEWCVPRRAAVLSVLEASSRLTPTQVRTLVQTQQPHLTISDDGSGAVTLGSQFRAALACLREEARLHGRLVVVGQAWAGSNRLIELLTPRQSVLVTRALSGAVAGEVLCRVLDDVQDRRVFGAAEETLLRQAWREAHPLPAYFRRPNRQ